MPGLLSEDEQALAAGYVLGDLTPEEIAQLEQLVADNPAFGREIHALQVSLNLLPQSLSQVHPSTSVRENLVASQSSWKAGNWWRSPKSILKWLVGLLVLATAALALSNFRLRYQLQLAQESRVDRVAAILQQPNSRLIALTGEGSAAGTLLFTPGRWQEVVVSLGNLPPLPPDQIYRMWLALDNSDIIYCGEFNTNQDGGVFIRLTPPETPPKGVKATELFVTIDTRTASPSPSSQRVLQGEI